MGPEIFQRGEILGKNRVGGGEVNISEKLHVSVPLIFARIEI